MRFLSPQALLWLIPVGLAFWRSARARGAAWWLRGAVLLLLVLALARPELRLHRAGSDVVVVVDRSRSMPPMALATAEELIRLLEQQRGPGDRLGVVSFGREARVEAALSAEARFGGFTTPVDGEASDLAAALDLADVLIPGERAGRVLVLSDGRATGLDPRGAARRLAARGVLVDVRVLGRDDGALDVAVTALEAPSVVAAKEPFLLTATVRATTEVEATLLLSRGGAPVAKASRRLAAGGTTVTFRDLVAAPGLAPYEVRVTAAGDGVAENDVGRAVVRVEGPPRVLLLTDKPAGALARALGGSSVAVEVRPPQALSMDLLDGVGAVVLEDVEAGRLSERGLEVLAQYVREAGGGLVMTGGRHAFGEGGYRKSPVEPLLPVSLEVREEQRKAAVAMAIVLDSSGSMGARIADGRTKMELAAEGVVGALELLDPRDEASVHMVDTGPHEIFPMSPVAAGLPLSAVARGFSGGGGIYIGVALETAERQILKSDKQTRHVVLFADASDSEEPGDYQRTLARLVAQGVTVSVIGMGAPTDSDASLLRDVADRGHGRLSFAEDVTSLPRLFSLETIALARSTYVETVTPTRLGGDLAQLGHLPSATAPVIGGYNLTYLRPGASQAIFTDDAAAAPIVAFWPRGAGRVAALMAEVDGAFTGPFGHWPGQRALLEQLVHWVLPKSPPTGEAQARARLSGDALHVTLELDPDAPPLAATPSLVLLSGDGHARPIELAMSWEDDDRVGAHWVLPGSGTWFPVVRSAGRLFRAPPVTLPWVPELQPALVHEGRDRLLAVARAGGGVERLAMAGLYQDAPGSQGAVPLADWLVGLGVGLVAIEVFVRRFFAAPRQRRPRPSAVGAPAASSGPPEPPRAEPPVEPPAPVRSALETARERARRRTGRPKE